MNEEPQAESKEQPLTFKDFRPDSLVFMGRNISVSFIEEGPWGSNVYGDFYAKEQRIRVLEGLTPIEEMDTFLHEVIHMVMFYMHIMMGQVDEEMITHRLATGLSSVLVENPHVAEYIAVISTTSTTELTNE
ncbi:hypothetical protein UFOVP562_33 [uncultured Caudovirales phage]|uniref:Uncharacterized protein n=1 Tax=uncultured Caudovirales phage TaxID=2100421 RepID=A0A6J5MYI5_9CAUD|nr:hypothetical protein UFOVP562_33 [uncultured Caudovirales phage]